MLVCDHNDVSGTISLAGGVYVISRVTSYLKNVPSYDGDGYRRDLLAYEFDVIFTKKRMPYWKLTCANKFYI